MISIIKICVNCKTKINIKEDIVKYRCPKCKTEYEYIDCVDSQTELIESVEENAKISDN